MRYLLDVNVLLASVWSRHPKFAIADAWLKGKAVVVCPISELGFLRISSNPKALNFTMTDARMGLEKFLSDTKATRIADDLPALDSKPTKSDDVTDHYLSDLASRHGLKLATFDTNLKHAAAELVS